MLSAVLTKASAIPARVEARSKHRALAPLDTVLAVVSSTAALHSASNLEPAVDECGQASKVAR